MIINSATQDSTPNIGCRACADENALSFDFTMAFQPIVDFERKEIFAQEALCRGLDGESAGDIIAKAHSENLYKFDQTCRVKAVRLASKLNVKSFLSINFLPNAVYRPENCIRTTIEAATEYNFPLDKIIFEITEVEKVKDNSHLKNIVTEYQRQGFKTAIDDFGAGYSGLNLLSVFQPDFLKLDMELTRAVDTSKIKLTIVKGILHVAQDLGICVIAEGVETKNELETLQELGINLFQGYYFAKPAFESLAEIPREIFPLRNQNEAFDLESQTLCVGEVEIVNCEIKKCENLNSRTS
jgi:EAL domain-containing protein (putative c-di-GMP-specific phosphodiesterase class I)